MKIEVTKKELRAITDCVALAIESLRGKPPLSLWSPMDIVRRFGKIDLNEMWSKLHNMIY